MDIENKLNEIVEARCVSKQALALKAGIPYQTLYRCLRGEQDLKADEFLAVCKVLEVNPNDFLGE